MADEECESRGAVPSMPEVNTSELDQVLRKAYAVGRLLAGSSHKAEQAMLKAIESWDPKLSKDQIVLGAIRNLDIEWDGADSSETMLPVGLRELSRIPPLRRECFVLRILAGLAPEVCGELLQLKSSQVDEYLCAALRLLPSLVAQEPAA